MVYIGGAGAASVSLRQTLADAPGTPYDRYAVGLHHLCLDERTAGL